MVVILKDPVNGADGIPPLAAGTAEGRMAIGGAAEQDEPGVETAAGDVAVVGLSAEIAASWFAVVMDNCPEEAVSDFPA